MKKYKRFNSDVVVLLVLPLLIGGYNASAETVVVGKTYDLSERSALEEIKERAKNVDWDTNKPRERINKAYEAAKIPLPKAKKTRTRRYIPFYTLERDITDGNNNVIYPRGFRYNPLDYTFVPGRILVIGSSEKDIEWLKTHRKTGDNIITAGGDVRRLAAEHGITAFVYQKKMAQRLGVEVVPSIISQKDNAFEIKEFELSLKMAKQQ